MILNLVGRCSELVTLSYRTPAESVRGLVPAGLELATRGPWAYWRVTACRIDDLRLAGLAALNTTHRLTSYQLHVQAMTDMIHLRRGLYVVRTEADPPLIERFGQVLAALQLTAASPTTHMTVDDRPPPYPHGSSFTVTATALDYLARPLPLLTTDGRVVRFIEQISNIEPPRPRPVCVVDATLPCFSSLAQHDLFLELATVHDASAIRWRIGHEERLLQPGATGVMDTRTIAQRRQAAGASAAAVVPSLGEPVGV